MQISTAAVVFYPDFSAFQAVIILEYTLLTRISGLMQLCFQITPAIRKSVSNLPALQ
jgi:hypothetical protein